MTSNRDKQSAVDMRGSMQVENELRTYLQVLWRYKWMAVACALIASAVALGVSVLLTPMYSATATLRVASAPGGAVDYVSLSSLTRLSNTYVEIATSDISLDKVAARLGLPEQPEVEVEVVPETELIKIRASNPDPALSRDIANTLAGMMVEQSVELYGGSAPTARQILEGQLTQAKADLDLALAEYDRTLRLQTSGPAGETGSAPASNVETLARLISVRQQIYTDLLQKYEAARTNELLRANAITLFEPAGLPARPSSPKTPLNVALGLVGGAVVGAMLAFLFEARDQTLRGPEDVEAVCELPILCQIPERRRSSIAEIEPTGALQGRFVPLPVFHQLAARLTLSDSIPKPAAILVTSAEPGAGKSTITANLAISLAREGYKVVLADMDFRLPRVHKVLDLPNKSGLSDHLCGNAALESVLSETPYRQLRVATAGSILYGVSEWLSPDKIALLIERLLGQCDYLLMDAPALLSVADASYLASQADAVVVVVAKRRTNRQDLRNALQQLHELRAKVVGVVVNRMPKSRLYAYYPDRPSHTDNAWRKRRPTSETAASRSNGAGSQKERADAVAQLQQPL